ncbi:MAG: hypothetical protein CM1200mP16_08250 [Nitrospina sp.]|nr:MAG: hypothetical protein CM1200mP16_08250 [Nitrospina sp.]
MAAGTIGMLASIPGQTMAVGVFSEYLISKTGLNRIELSFAYMTGTILSSLFLPFAGKLLDLIGARIMILVTGIGLGISLLFFSQTVSLINFFSPVSSKYLSHSFFGNTGYVVSFFDATPIWSGHYGYGQPYRFSKMV